MHPFLTFYTPTYQRPLGLSRCMASVQGQSIVEDIEQIVIPDHVGLGIGGMYGQVKFYADAVHGRYVSFLCDDDVLAGPTVVEQLRDFAQAEGYPPLILVQTKKGDAVWPFGEPWPPRCGYIDLNCLVVRSDIWRNHVGAYGQHYEGDYAFAAALHQVGVYASFLPLLMSIGGVSRGVAEPREVGPNQWVLA